MLCIFKFKYKSLFYVFNIFEEWFWGILLNLVIVVIICNFFGFFNRKVNGIIMRWEIVYCKLNVF